MKKIKLLIPLILLTHLVLLIYLRFTAWPEMILWPYLQNMGLLPWRDIVIIYPPGLIVLLGFLGKIFGISLLGLKLYTWILILSTDLLVFWVTQKITKNQKIAFFSLLFYVLWQPFFEGNALWFDLVLAPLGLLVFYFLISKKFFWSGLFFGLALAVKQTAFWFFPPILATAWILGEFKRKSFLSFVWGLGLPLIICLVYLLLTGLWREFYHWAIDFGVFYLPRAPGQIQLPTIKQILLLLIPFAIIFPSLLSVLRRRNIVKGELAVLLIFWIFFSSLGVFPRFEYFHFQPALPFLAILFGISVVSLKISLKKIGWLIFFVLVILGTVYLQQRFYRLNWQQPTRFFEEDIMKTAQWLQKNTAPAEKIYILNSWDHLYALSGTLPAVSPLIHTLPWHLEYPGMQEKYVTDLIKNKPRIIVFQPYSEKGLGSYKPEKIDQFLKENYTLSEVVADRFWILKLK